MTRSYNRLRETTFDLYVERDTLPAYFRFIALFSTWLICAGYIFFALSFSVHDENLRISRDLLIGLGSALLIVGYIAGATAAFLSRSLLFLIDNAIYPILTASLVGILITVLTYTIQKNSATKTVYMLVPLITSCITTGLSTVILSLVYREVSRIKSRDERRRWHVALGPYGGEIQSATTHHRSPSGPEDDAQRRQLMRLLQERHEHPSMENMRGTYKIDIPGDQRTDIRTWESSPAPPQKFQISDLLPWNNAKTGTFKDARERRREQIERGGIPHVGMMGSSSHQRSISLPRDLSDPNGQSSGQLNPPSSWGYAPATRYA